MDPENPIVKLCAAGMQAEFEGRYEDAQALFMEAWALRRDDFEACIAAHYVARHQASPEDTLHWNQVALNHAARVGDERVSNFYPSLYLNLGHSYETLGDWAEASKQYEFAAAQLNTLTPSPYADMVRQGLSNAHERLLALYE